MQTFSRILAELYELADHAALDVFPYQALDLLRQLVRFDGAFLCAGSADDASGSAGAMQQAGALGYGGIVFLERRQIPACHALKDQAAADAGRAAYRECPAGCSGQDGAGPARMPDRLPRRLMLHESVSGRSRSLVLCRRAGKEFGLRDKDRMQAVWPHLMRALAINRQRFLARLVVQQADCAFALVDRHGSIESADACFGDFLALEWPGHAGGRLPAAVAECWQRGRPYIGGRLEIRLRQHAGNLVCIATPYTAVAGLTKTEGIVARYFASGLNHKEVAQALGLSHHTVRTHLKQAYSKLGVHDKAALANRFAPSLAREQAMHAMPRVSRTSAIVC